MGAAIFLIILRILCTENVIQRFTLGFRIIFGGEWNPKRTCCITPFI